MNARNIRRVGEMQISIDSVAHGEEYSVRLPRVRAAMPAFEMTAEPKSDRRYFREGAAF